MATAAWISSSAECRPSRCCCKIMRQGTAGTFAAATTYPAPGANEIAVADVNGDGEPDIIVSNGATNPVVNGVVTTHPGVLLQSATSRGTFGAL